MINDASKLAAFTQTGTLTLRLPLVDVFVAANEAGACYRIHLEDPHLQEVLRELRALIARHRALQVGQISVQSDRGALELPLTMPDTRVTRDGRVFSFEADLASAPGPSMKLLLGNLYASYLVRASSNTITSLAEQGTLPIDRNRAYTHDECKAEQAQQMRALEEQYGLNKYEKGGSGRVVDETTYRGESIFPKVDA